MATSSGLLQLLPKTRKVRFFLELDIRGQQQYGESHHYCDTPHRHFMSAMIERIPLTTERKALKVIRVCEQHQLTAEGKCYSIRVDLITAAPYKMAFACAL